MIGKEVLGKKVVTVPEVYEILEGIEGELTYEQKITKEYAEKMRKTDAKTAKEKVKALVEKGLDEELAVKIVNIMPKSAMELHAILSKEKGVSEDLYGEILEITK